MKDCRDETLLEILGRGASDAPAIVVPEGRTLTYGELRADVTRAANALAELGLGHGDRVAIVLPNGAEVIVAFLAATIAATAAPMNPAYTEDEFRFYLEDTSARALVVPSGGGEAARRGAGHDRDRGVDGWGWTAPPRERFAQTIREAGDSADGR